MSDTGQREVELRALAGAVALQADRVHALDLHAAGCDGAGLIKAQHVHARERLDAIELLGEHVAAREADRRDRKHGGGEQDEALRNHAEQRPDRREDPFGYILPRSPAPDQPHEEGDGGVRRGARPGRVPLVSTRKEEGSAERNHDDAGEADDRVQRVHDLGVDLLDIFRLVVDAGDVVVGANVDDARVNEPGIEEAAAHQLVSRLLADEIALPRQQTLVDLRIAADDDGIRRYLVAATELEDIVQDDLVEIELDLRAVAERHCLLGSQQRQSIDHALRAQGLHDADARVQKDDAQEGEVLEGAGRYHQDGEHDVDEVEQGAEVLEYELAHGLGLQLGIHVDLARGDAVADLLGGQARELRTRGSCLVGHWAPLEHIFQIQEGPRTRSARDPIERWCAI